MSEEQNGGHVTPENTDQVGTQDDQTSVNDGKNTVQYDTYRRVMSKLKTRENEITDIKEQFNKLRNEKLEAEGNKDQLIESLRTEVSETKTKLRTTVGGIAKSQAMNAIVDEAVKAGCNSPDVVKKFLEEDIQNLSFDNDFNPDREQVRELIENARKTAPVLFTKEAPRVGNHNLSKSGTADVKPNLKKMSLDDLMKTWSQAE